MLHWILWINFGVTVVATLYFGWHYIADDVAGIVIALVAFYVGGLASGQKFDRTACTRIRPPRPRPSPSSADVRVVPRAPIVPAVRVVCGAL